MHSLRYREESIQQKEGTPRETAKNMMVETLVKMIQSGRSSSSESFNKSRNNQN